MLKRAGKILYRKKRPEEEPDHEKVFFDIQGEGSPEPSYTPKMTGIEEVSTRGTLQAGEVTKSSQEEVDAFHPPEDAEVKTTRKRRFSTAFYVWVSVMVLAGFGAGWQFWKHSRPQIFLPSVELSKDAALLAGSQGDVIYPLKPFIVPLTTGKGCLALISLDLSISIEAIDFVKANLAVVRSEIFRTLYSRYSGDPTSKEVLDQAAHAVSLRIESNWPVRLYCKKITTI